MNYSGQFDRVVASMIGKFGGTGTLRVFTDGAYVDGEVTRTSTDYTIELAINDFPQANSGDKSRFGTLIEASDKEALIRPVNKTNPAATQPTIHANRDLVIINGIEWKILALKENNPSSVNAILFDMHLRR